MVRPDQVRIEAFKVNEQVATEGDPYKQCKHGVIFVGVVLVATRRFDYPKIRSRLRAIHLFNEREES